MINNKSMAIVEKVCSFSPTCQKCGYNLVKDDWGIWVCPFHGTDFMD